MNALIGQPRLWYGPLPAALLPRSEATQLSRLGVTALSKLDESLQATFWGALLSLIAPKLEAPQLLTAWQTLIAHFPEIDTNWNGLAILAPYLGPATKQSQLTTITAALLDYCCCDNAVGGSPGDFARHFSSARSLAGLLSHPGKVVFPRRQVRSGTGGFAPREAEGVQKPSPPPRRFRNLYDTAEWIQKNWPDFDLETNCPATWRGSR
jgi:hypothetical protein